MSGTSQHQTIEVLPAGAIATLPPPRLEVRQRRLGSVLAGTVAMLLAIASLPLAFSWYQAGAPAAVVLFVVFCVGGFLALYAWLCLNNARKAGAPGAWVLRENGFHLLINLRSHLNAHFDPAAPTVLVLPSPRVRSLTIMRQRGLRTHAGNNRVIFENPIGRVFLDIAFEGEREKVAAAIAAEAGRRGKTRFGSSRYEHGTVAMLPGNMIRIAWRDEHNRLTPDLARLRRALAGRYRIFDTDADAQTPIKTLDRAEQEARLLEMLERGERVQAIALARVLYNMGMTEAVEFVDGLRRPPANRSTEAGTR